MLFTAHALEEVLELGNEGVDRRGAHLFYKTIVPVQQFAVVGAEGLVRAPVNLKTTVEKIGFHQGAAAVGREAPDLPVGHLAGRQAGDDTVGKAQGGIDVVDRAIGATTTDGGEAHNRRLGQLEHQIDVVDHQIEHHRDIVGAVGIGFAHPCLINGVSEDSPHDTQDLIALDFGTPALNLLLEIKDRLTSCLPIWLLRIPGQCPDGSGTSEFWDDLVEEHVSVVLQGVRLEVRALQKLLGSPLKGWCLLLFNDLPLLLLLQFSGIPPCLK